MCYTKELSLLSFLFGITTSILLIKFGNSKYSLENKAIGVFFIYISFAQFIEYLIWSDLNCNKGYNKFASKFGPLLINLQPVVLYAVLSSYVPSSDVIPKNIMLILNGLYVIYVLYKYSSYIKKEENSCTTTNCKNHLNWKWKYDFNYIFYQALMFLNFINYYKNSQIFTLFVVVYILFFISYLKFNENIPELWCLLSTGVPIIILTLQSIQSKRIQI
jgi:hypothetical protein